MELIKRHKKRFFLHQILLISKVVRFLLFKTKALQTFRCLVLFSLWVFFLGSFDITCELWSTHNHAIRLLTVCMCSWVGMCLQKSKPSEWKKKTTTNRFVSIHFGISKRKTCDSFCVCWKRMNTSSKRVKKNETVKKNIDTNELNARFNTNQYISIVYCVVCSSLKMGAQYYGHWRVLY